MKLYLSSYRIPDVKAFSDFVGKESTSIKLALILNGKDDKTLEEREKKKKELVVYFSNLGFQVEEVNLLDYLGDKNLLEKLREFDVAWFNGGNTYCLRWAIAQSHSEEIIKQALKDGVVYGGDSAGAIIVGPTLKYFDKADNPGNAPGAIYTGLNFIDFSIIPHWGSVEFEHALGDIETMLKSDGYKTRRLTDDEYLLIKEGKVIN